MSVNPTTNRYQCNFAGKAFLGTALTYDTVSPVSGTETFIHPDFTTYVCSGYTFTYQVAADTIASLTPTTTTALYDPLTRTFSWTPVTYYDVKHTITVTGTITADSRSATYTFDV